MKTVLKILIAEDNELVVEPLKRLIHLKLEREMTDIEIHVDIVSTLREAIALSEDANTTILDLTLADAGPEEVIASLHLFRPPIIIMTGETDETLLARCLRNGASSVLIKGSTRDGALCSAILRCLGKDVLMSTAK